MAGELILPEVASSGVSTPAASKDAIHQTNDTPSRLARKDSGGNIYYEQEQVIIALTADYTLTDSNTAQKAFNSPASGQITLPATTSWEFESVYMISNVGTTSHTWSTLFAGTASITSIDYASESTIAGVTSAATIGAGSVVNAIFQATGAGSLPTTALVVTNASTSATEFVFVKQRGIIRINAAGTLIPQVKLSAATTGASKMLRGSFFRMSPFGSNTAASLGLWS